jgi:hypothetical protein
MRVRIGDKVYGLPRNTAEPVVELDAAEQGERDAIGILHIDVSNAQGLVARFWITERLRNGRPQIIVTTKVAKDKEVQRSKSVTGTFNTL